MVHNSYTAQQKEQARQTDMIDFLEKYEVLTFAAFFIWYKCRKIVVQAPFGQKNRHLKDCKNLTNAYFTLVRMK